MQFRDHAAISSKRDFFMVDPRKLKVDDSYNVRDMQSKETREHIAALKASIIANGVKVPLEVRLGGRDQLYIVAGHCRHVAVLEAIKEGAEIEAVPCIPEGKGTSEIDRTVNLIVSNSGKALAPLEVSAVVKRLVNFGWTEKQIAERLGWKSTNTVKQHLEMLEMPEEVKDHVRKGDVSTTTAVKEVRRSRGEAAANIRKAKEEQKKKGKSKATPKALKATRAPSEESQPRLVQGGYTAPAGDGEKPPLLTMGSGVTPALQQGQYERQVGDYDRRPVAPIPGSTGFGVGDLDIMIELTKQAHLCVQHNQSDDHPGWWSTGLVEAIRKARDVVERLTGKPMEFAEIADRSSQETEAA